MLKLDILYEDEQYIFINKPSGLLSIADRFNAEIPSVAGTLRRMYDNIFIVHRLDRDTSGCICFAKNEETHKYTSMLFEQREVEKYYTGIVHGSPVQKSGRIEQPLMEHPTIKGKMVVNVKNGKPSVTDYEVVETYGLFSYLKYQLHTGRTHQIRVHSMSIGHPIVCDELYGDGKPVFISSFKKRFNLSKQELEEKPIMNRLALHAFQLKFKNAEGKLMDVQAPLPRDMHAMLNQCKKWLK
jgi:23S rRNA pseudouridine1911/1915/1917 synthase